MTVVGNEVRGCKDRRQRRLELADLVGIQDIDAQARGALQIDAELIVCEPLFASIDEELAGLMEEMLEAGILQERPIGVESRSVECGKRLGDPRDSVTSARA